MNKPNKDILIKRSKIQGKGVFANRDFVKGEMISEWDAKRTLTIEEVNKSSETERKFITGYKGGKYILLQTPERYINHSCDPNIVVENFVTLLQET